MISSIVLLILNYIGKINPDEGLGFFKWYFIALTIETAVTLIFVKKLDKRDMETNFGRNK